MPHTQLLRDLVGRYPEVVRLARRLVAVVPQSMRLGSDFWTWYAFFEESETWSAGQLRAYQMERLRALLSRLAQTSEFYRQRLAGVDIEHIQTLEQYQAAVPVLSREEFRLGYDGLKSTASQAGRLTRAQTSGTTGLALQFYHTAADDAREWAAICHQWKRVGYVPGVSRRAEFRGLVRQGRLVEVDAYQNIIRCSILHLQEPHIRRYADEIEKHHIDYYHGYPSALYLLAKEICRAGLRFPQRDILLASENVFDWQLAQIQEAFPGSRIFAHYGCAERTVLGGWCEFRREYHVLPQYSLVEVMPETNEIVGTNLYNEVNGFVRYRLTDTALQTDYDVCRDCHRPYIPRLVELGGRTEDYLYSPEKGWIPPAIVTYPLKALKIIRELQFVQRDRNEVLVRYSVCEQSAERLQVDLGHISSGLRELLGSEIKLRFEQVDDFARTPSGKFKWIVSELQEDAVLRR